MKLRDQLVDALKPLAGTRTFNLNVLTSTPRRTTSLFPYAHPRPRVFTQEIFVLCSEQSESISLGLASSSISRAQDASGQPQPSSSGGSSTGGDFRSQSHVLDSDEPPKTFVTAIEASIFHIPSTRSVTLYVAKVDSTGQGSRQSPTPALVSAFLSYYIDEETRPGRLKNTTLWVHVFARAERQYLFPNSADFEGKKPLSDIKLCAWWKRMLREVAAKAERRVKDRSSVGMNARCFYVLPSLSELEAAQALNERIDGPSRAQWTYGHPYAQADLTPPCGKLARGSDVWNLGQIIPSFDDDPKSRFMDEIALTAHMDGLRSPSRKRRRMSEAEESTQEGSDSKKITKAYHAPSGELGQVNAEEFWERMSYRQECVAGKVTGFFVLIFPPAPTSDVTLNINPLAPQPGEVSHHVVHRVVDSLMNNHEFSTRERAVRATALLENVIKGLTSGSLPDFSIRAAPDIHPPRTRTIPEAFLLADADAKDSFESLKMNSAENGETPLADEGLDERSKTPAPEPIALLGVPKTPPRRPLIDTDADITPNPFPEPELSASTYHDYVHAMISISNSDFVAEPKVVERKEQVVTMLAVRKKRK